MSDGSRTAFASMPNFSASPARAALRRRAARASGLAYSCALRERGRSRANRATCPCRSPGTARRICAQRKFCARFLMRKHRRIWLEFSSKPSAAQNRLAGDQIAICLDAHAPLIVLRTHALISGHDSASKAITSGPCLIVMTVFPLQGRAVIANRSHLVATMRVTSPSVAGFDFGIAIIGITLVIGSALIVPRVRVQYVPFLVLHAKVIELHALQVCLLSRLAN